MYRSCAGPHHAVIWMLVGDAAGCFGGAAAAEVVESNRLHRREAALRHQLTKRGPVPCVRDLLNHLPACFNQTIPTCLTLKSTRVLMGRSAVAQRCMVEDSMIAIEEVLISVFEAAGASEIIDRMRCPSYFLQCKSLHTQF